MAESTIKESRRLCVTRKAFSVTINASAHANSTVQFGETISNIATIILEKSPNPAWIFGSVQQWDNSSAILGFYNTYNAQLTDNAVIAIYYYE